LGSIGILEGLKAKKPVSSKRDRAYFHWDSEIPLLDLAISKPRKYFKGPRIFN